VTAVLFPVGSWEVQRGGEKLIQASNGRLSRREAEKLYSSVKGLCVISGNGTLDRIKAFIAAQSVAALSDSEIQSIYQATTGVTSDSVCSGGDGSTEELAVVISCSSIIQGIHAE
jgi:hypothetical protein